MRFRNFHFAGKESRIGAGQLVPHFNVKGDRTGVSTAFVFRNVPAAALGLPPTAFFYLAGLAIELNPGTGTRD